MPVRIMPRTKSWTTCHTLNCHLQGPGLPPLHKTLGVKTMNVQVVWRSNALLSHPSLVAQWLEHLHGKRKVLGSIPGLGTPFSPEYDYSLHQEESLKRSWMIGEDLRRNTLAWYTCPDRCINVWLRPEDHQLRLENFYAPSFPQVGHWNSVLCSRLNLDSTIKCICIAYSVCRCFI